MGTKIYNGRILRSCTFDQALNKQKSARAECVELAQTAMAAELAKLRCFWMDMDENYHPIPKTTRDSPYWRLRAILQAEEAKVSKGIRSADWDFTFKVCLIPDGCNLLRLHYIENNPGFLDLLTRLGFEDFHYQDSTDRPESISETDWQERDAAWSRAMPSGRPIEHGLTYDWVTWSDAANALENRDLVLGSTPTDEARQSMVAFELVAPNVGPYHRDRNTLRELDEMFRTATKNRAPHVLLAKN